MRPKRSITLTTWHPISGKVDTNFAYNRESLSMSSSLAGSGHGVFYIDDRSWDSSFGITTGCELYNGGVGVRVPV
jgi:hypothetical protein